MRCIFYIATFVLFAPQFVGQSNLDSLLNLLPQSKSKVETVDLYIEISKQLRGDSVLNFANKAKKIATKIDYRNGIASANMRLAAYNYEMGNLEEALDYYLEIQRDSANIKLSYVNSTYNGIGAIYRRFGEYEKALEIYGKSLNLAVILDKPLGFSMVYNNIGIVYDMLEELDSALYFYDKSYSYLDGVENQQLKGRLNYALLVNMGILHAKKEEYSKALENYNKALEFGRKENNPFYISNALVTVADIYRKQKNYEASEKALQESLEITIESDGKLIAQDVYNLLYLLYKDWGKYNLALENLENYNLFNDSVQGARVKSNMNELEVRFETEKKEHDLKLKSAEIAHQKTALQAEEDKGKFQWYIILLGGVILILVIIVLISKSRINKKLEKLSIVASKTDNAILIADKIGNIEWINDGFTKLFGYDFVQLISEKGENLLKISNESNIKQFFEISVNEKTSVVYSAENTTRKGRRFWTQTTITPIINDKNEVVKIVTIDTEITELKRAEKKIELQHSKLIAKNLQITDSIDYAKRIQQGMFPSREKVLRIFPEICIYHNPKDIVSGDFYWVFQKGNRKYLAVVDCTGHGVPGAFMTIIGINILNQIVENDTFSKPHEIIQELNTQLRKLLSTKKNTKDGMDIGLVCVEGNNLEFSGTHISCYLSTEKEITELKGQRGFIGYSDKLEIETQKASLENTQMIYLFTDGFPDQKGGDKGKKYYYQPFINLLHEIATNEVDIQHDKLKERFIDWKGNLKQLDDVLVVGFKV